MRYLARFLDASDPTASLKHLAYAIAVCASTGWLSYDILRSPMTGNWVAAFAAFLAAVVTGKVVGAAVPPALGAVVPETLPAKGAKIEGAE